MSRRIAFHCLLLAAVVCGLTYTGTRLELKASDWAAWAQAVFSVAAIGVAIWISERQHRIATLLELDRRFSHERQKIKIVLALVQNARTTLDFVCEERDRSDIGLGPSNSVDLLNDCRSQLGELSPFDMPHEDLVVLCNAIGQELVLLTHALQLERESILELNFTGEWSGRIDRGMGSLTSLTDKAFEVIEAELKSRPAQLASLLG